MVGENQRERQEKRLEELAEQEKGTNLGIWISGKDLKLLLRLMRIHYLERQIPEPTVREYIRYLFAKDYEETRERIKQRRRKIVEG